MTSHSKNRPHHRASWSQKRRWHSAARGQRHAAYGQPMGAVKRPTVKPARIILRWLVAVLMLSVLLWLLLNFASQILSLYWELPTGREAAAILQSPRVVVQRNKAGELTRYCMCPAPVSGPEFPAFLRDAVIAVEDRRFFTHQGLDYIGIARALVTNLKSGGIEQGGSTLTQQLAKTITGGQRKLTRKLKELILARRIERRFTKDQLVNLYLNQAYFGRNSWGIENAARRHFGKRASDLELIEIAQLVGLLQSPARYDPANHPAESFRQAALVLDKMVERGSISRHEASDAKRARPPKGDLDVVAPALGHFLDTVVSQISVENLKAGDRWLVSVTLDIEKQLVADRVVKASATRAIRRNAREIALISLDDGGDVVAMIGGRNYQTSQFNRVTMAKRQPASTFKFLTYLAALESGLDPDDEIDDLPVSVEGWQPRNYDARYLGEISLTRAFSESRNAATVRLANQVGFDKVASVASRFGLPGSTRPAAVLGTELVTPLQLASAYASIALGGLEIRPRLYRVVIDQNGRVISRRKPGKGRRHTRRRDARDMVQMLEASAIKSLGSSFSNYAGKSGTSSDFRDAWFAGFSDTATTVVWLGNDDNSAMNRVGGGQLPASIFQEYMNKSIDKGESRK